MINNVHAGTVGAAHQSPLASQLSKRAAAQQASEPATSEFARFLADVLTKVDHSTGAATAASSTVKPRAAQAASASSSPTIAKQ